MLKYLFYHLALIIMVRVAGPIQRIASHCIQLRGDEEDEDEDEDEDEEELPGEHY